MRRRISSLFARLFDGPASAVFRGMGTLALGTGAARVIGVASIPVLTRIYSPEDYGVLSIFTALVAMLVPMLTLRYGVAIPLPRQDGMAMNLMALAAVLMLGMTLMVSLLLGIFGSALLGQVSMEVLAPYWWLIALGILGTGSYELLSLWATRRRAYRIIAQTQVTQSALSVVIKIGLGLLAFKPMGLLIGQVVAQSGGIGSFITRFWVDFRRTAGMISLRRMVFLARYFRGFPIYRLPSQFLLVFSTQAPFLFTATLYGAETTGELGLAMMTLALPINLLGQSVGNAYYAEISQLSRKSPQKILEITKLVQKRLFMMAIPPTLVIMIFGPELFRLAFGDIWSTAGLFASILSICLLLQFTSAPLIQVLNLFNKQILFLAINTIRVFLLGFLFYFSFLAKLTAMNFLASYSVIMVFYYSGISMFIIQFLANQIIITTDN